MKVAYRQKRYPESVSGRRLGTSAWTFVFPLRTARYAHPHPQYGNSVLKVNATQNMIGGAKNNFFTVYNTLELFSDKKVPQLAQTL